MEGRSQQSDATVDVNGSNRVVNTCDTVSLSVVSYNMHGFNQGYQTVRDLAMSNNIDIFLLQEHWLTPANLCKFEEYFSQYSCFGSSAMTSCVENGILRGRPFGGVMTLVKKKLQKHSKIVCAADRYVIVSVGDLLIINVYLPCVGSDNRLLVYEEVLGGVCSFMQSHPSCEVVFGGDFNTDLDMVNEVSDLVNCFIADNGLYRCDVVAGNRNRHCTYYNEALNHESILDYFLVSNGGMVFSFDVLNLCSNLSDHLPVMIGCSCKLSLDCGHHAASDGNGVSGKPVMQLRWDHANLEMYRHLTGLHLQSVLSDLMDLESLPAIAPIAVDQLYARVVDILRCSSDSVVPSCRKNFLKFWWDSELDELKDRSIASCRMWKAAGKPRSGPIFSTYRKDKAAYKNGIRNRQRDEKSVYTNELHEALLEKQGAMFWKCWRSKFESRKRSVNCVDGISDPGQLAQHFASHFATVSTNHTATGAARLKSRYDTMRGNYCGCPSTEFELFDAELVELVIYKMKRGKAAGLDGITTEHLLYSHALLPGILAKLFNIMLSLGHAPSSFGQSYTVPILKSGCNVYGKSVSVDDFRGVSISPVISKVLEHCILDRYSHLFVTSDNQFGFKKDSSCAHAIYIH